MFLTENSVWRSWVIVEVRYSIANYQVTHPVNEVTITINTCTCVYCLLTL